MRRRDGERERGREGERERGREKDGEYIVYIVYIAESVYHDLSVRYGESVVLTAVLVETGPLLNHLTKPCRRTVKPDKDMEP